VPLINAPVLGNICEYHHKSYIVNSKATFSGPHWYYNLFLNDLTEESPWRKTDDDNLSKEISSNIYKTLANLFAGPFAPGPLAPRALPGTNVLGNFRSHNVYLTVY